MFSDLDSFQKYAGYIGIAIAVFAGTYGYNKRFLDWLRFQSIGTRDYIVERLETMFVQVSPNKVLLGQFLLSFGLGSLVLLAFLPDFFPGLMFGTIVTVVGWKAPRPIVDMLYRKRVQKLVLQMVDGLSLMSNGLKSGLSVVQALELVVREMPNPIHQEFKLILSENQLGLSVEEAFTKFATRIKNDDVEMFVTSVNILKETGGNLAETFDTITVTIRERIKVEAKIQAMTTQGFMQGMIIMAIIPVLGLYLAAADPEFMAPLVTTTLGWVVVAVIIALEIAAFVVIMKIIKIDV